MVNTAAYVHISTSRLKKTKKTPRLKCCSNTLSCIWQAHLCGWSSFFTLLKSISRSDSSAAGWKQLITDPGLEELPPQFVWAFSASHINLAPLFTVLMYVDDKMEFDSPHHIYVVLHCPNRCLSGFLMVMVLFWYHNFIVISYTLMQFWWKLGEKKSIEMIMWH